MKYAEWNKLDDEQKRNTHWRHHPRIRIATIFSVLFAIVFIVVMMRIFQNRRLHVNRKPTKQEAFAIAKAFIKDRVKEPQSATFSKNDFNSVVDTAQNVYQVSSYVNVQDSAGKFNKSAWQVKLSYKGGDWADKGSWDLVNASLDKKAVK